MIGVFFMPHTYSV